MEGEEGKETGIRQFMGEEIEKIGGVFFVVAYMLSYFILKEQEKEHRQKNTSRVELHPVIFVHVEGETFIFMLIAHTVASLVVISLLY